ncbi:MAG TPA: hypothetical protein VIZ18_14055 [Ktedonobacteraceae bacterium]
MSSEQARTDPTVPLIEQVAQPANDADKEPALLSVQDQPQDAPVLPEEEGVIWTPRFIILFTVTLAFGLSLESLLTQGWAIRWFTGIWVFLGHLVLVSVSWIILMRVSRSRWMRLGAVFGLIFVAFVTINIMLQSLLFQPSSYLLAHVNVVTFLALAGCYICLTIDRLPVGSWDAWVLGLTPVLGIVLLVPVYILRSDRSLAGLENSISVVALILSTLIWWIRPTCWRNAPGPTLLFGGVPLLLLLLDMAFIGSGSFNFFPVNVTQNATATFSSRQTVFFFSQVVLLFLLLAVMRLVYSEKRM